MVLLHVHSHVMDLYLCYAMSAEHVRGVILCLCPAQWWIGNAAEDGKAATVFARLRVPAPDGSGSVDDHGVHAFVVPLRDASGQCLPGVEIQDCGYKVGHLAPASINTAHSAAGHGAGSMKQTLHPASCPGSAQLRQRWAPGCVRTQPALLCAGRPEWCGQRRHSLHARARAAREPAGPLCQRGSRR